LGSFWCTMGGHETFGDLRQRFRDYFSVFEVHGAKLYVRPSTAAEVSMKFNLRPSAIGMGWVKSAENDGKREPIPALRQVPLSRYQRADDLNVHVNYTS